MDMVTIEDGGWLSDIHISAACKILQLQFPDVAGFQDPIKWQNKSFKRIRPICPNYSHQWQSLLLGFIVLW